MGKKKYLEITETLKELPVDEFQGLITEQIKRLKLIIDNYPDHTQIYISYDNDYNTYSSGSFQIIGTRSETDKERDKRLAKGRKERERKAEIKAAEETAEKAELKRLLIKYKEDLING